MVVNGRKLVLIEKDTQGKPDVGKSMLAEAFGDDDAAIAVGRVVGVALAMLPVAQEHQKDLIVEPRWPTARRARTGIATFPHGGAIPRRTRCRTRWRSASRRHDRDIGQDYAFGRDGVAAFRGCAQEPAQTRVRGIPRRPTRRFHGKRAAHFDALKNERRQEVICHHLGGRRQSVRQDPRRSIRSGSHRDRLGRHILAALQSLQAAARHGGRDLLLLRDPKDPVNRLAGGGAQEALNEPAGLLHRRAWRLDRIVTALRRRSRARPRT